MKYRFLGSSGLEVSEICYGVMTFTGKTGWTHLGSSDEKDAKFLTDYAIDNGVNFFDTANVYSNGISEELLGKAVRGKRNELVIATKAGLKMKEGPNGNGLSRKHIIQSCDESLRRLQTDYIDLYYTHSVDFIVPMEETLSTLDMLVKQGKVRYIGCSNYFAWQIIKSGYISQINGWEKFVALQAYYSLLGRDIETEIIPACLDQGIGVLPWSPLHGGILTGKYQNKNKDNWPEGTRLREPGHHLPYDKVKGEQTIEEIKAIALKREVPMSRVAFNYLLRKPGVSSLVIGARNLEQLKENIAVSDFELSDEEVNRLDEVSAEKRKYPDWYFDIWRKERMTREAFTYGKEE